MLLVVHASIGALIGKKIQNNFLAFAISFVAHFIMDFLPHGDHEIVNNFKAKKQTAKLYVYLLSDAISTILLIIAILSSDNFTNTKGLFYGIIGGILPDIIVFIFHLSKGHIFNKFAKIHDSIHTFLDNKKPISFILGLIIQISFFVILIKYLF